MRTKVRTHQKRFTFFLLNREFPPPCPPRHGFGMLAPFPESSAASALPMSLFRPRMLLSVALIGLLGSLFIRSYERGERVHLAMVARGYDGTLPSRGTGS